MRRITCVVLVIFAALLYLAPGSRALMSGVAYTDFANVFTSNQRINAGLGVNVAPGSTGTISASGGIFERSRSGAMGEWVSYTPTWTCSGSGCSLGNGTVAGSYTLVGKTVIGQLKWTPGSTTTFGSSVTYTWAAPQTGTVAAIAVGTSMAFHHTIDFRVCASYMSSTTTISAICDNSANIPSNTVPFTWSNGDYLIINFVYEMA